MRWWTGVVMSAVIAAMAVAGCTSTAESSGDGTGAADVTGSVANGRTSAADSADYQKRLDADCASFFSFVQGLPQRQLDEDLTADRIRTLAHQRSAEFAAQVRELTPPPSLKDAHERILALLTPGVPGTNPDDDVAQVRSYLTDLAHAYEAAGADGCAAEAHKNLQQVRDPVTASTGG